MPVSHKFDINMTTSSIDLFSQLPLLVIDSSHGRRKTTLRELQALHESSAVVIDLWHTKCTKCPAALSKLNDEASEVDRRDVLYVAIALSLGDGNYDVASDAIEG